MRADSYRAALPPSDRLARSAEQIGDKATGCITGLIFVTIVVTVTTKRSKCAYCKVRFKPPARGRTPTYCSRSHRQRAYEQRRLKRAEQRGMPIKLLRTDVATLLAQRDFRDKVIGVLREVGVLPPKPGPDKGDLRLVKPPNPKN